MCHRESEEERIGVTVMDVGIDFIDQLLKTMRFLVIILPSQF